MNLPNKLTISRIIFTFFFMIFLFSQGLFAKIMAFFTFSIASLTDYYDGRIAKRTGSITNFGKLMDPIADKILIITAFIGFLEMGLIPGWMLVLILMRELLITGFRILALTKKVVLASELGGKQKVISQIVAIFTILFFIIFKDTSLKYFTFWNSAIEARFRLTILILMYITTTLTLISGVACFWRNRRVIYD